MKALSVNKLAPLYESLKFSLACLLGFALSIYSSCTGHNLPLPAQALSQSVNIPVLHICTEIIRHSRHYILDSTCPMMPVKTGANS